MSDGTEGRGTLSSDDGTVPPAVLALWRRAKPEVRRQLADLVRRGVDIDRALVVAREQPRGGDPLVTVYVGKEIDEVVPEQGDVVRAYLAAMPSNNSIALLTVTRTGIGISTCGRVRRDRR